MGAINVDNTGSGGAITLSSDGTNLLLGGSAVGGGADLYAANESSPAGQPSATGANAIAIGDSATASGADTFAIGELAIASGVSALALGKSRAAGNYGIAINVDSNAANMGAMSQYSIAIGTSTQAGAQGTNVSKSVALGNEAKAVGEHSTALGAGAVASGSYSISIAGGSTDSSATGGSSVGIGKGKSTGQGSVNISGNDASYNAQASGIVLGKANIPSGGSKGFSVNIDSHTNTYGGAGSNSIAMGKEARASGAGSIALSTKTYVGGAAATGSGSVAIGDGAAASGLLGIAIGRGATASGTMSMAYGRDSQATQEESKAFGYRSYADVVGCFAYASGYFGSANGDAQGRQYILREATTDATATVLTTDSNSASGTNQIKVPTDSVVVFDGVISACQNGVAAYAGWRVEGIIINDGGTTTVPTSAITVINNSSSWGLALSADNTNNSLAVTVTGEASHNIRWVANIRTVETIYA